MKPLARLLVALALGAAVATAAASTAVRKPATAPAATPSSTSANSSFRWPTRTLRSRARPPSATNTRQPPSLPRNRAPIGRRRALSLRQCWIVAST